MTIDVLITSGGTLQAFAKAQAEAEFLADTLGVRQKLLRADVASARKRDGLRWST